MSDKLKIKFTIDPNEISEDMIAELPSLIEYLFTKEMVSRYINGDLPQQYTDISSTDTTE